jgi:hypothetical protein
LCFLKNSVPKKTPLGVSQDLPYNILQCVGLHVLAADFVDALQEVVAAEDGAKGLWVVVEHMLVGRDLQLAALESDIGQLAAVEEPVARVIRDPVWTRGLNTRVSWFLMKKPFLGPGKLQ